MANSPVEETITLDIKGGLSDNLKSTMNEHEEAWKRVSSSVESTANRVEGIARTIGGLAGVVGVSALVSDFVRLENSANQAALAIGNVTGNVAQWRGLASGLLGLQAQYGIDPSAASSAVVNATGLAGGRYSTGQALQLARLTGLMGQGTGLDPAFLGTLTGQLAQAGNVSATSAAGYLPQVMATLGQVFQGPALGTQAQTAVGIGQMFAARFPFGNTPAITQQFAGLQTAAVQTNRIYADPAVYGGAVSALSGGFSSALNNPSAAWLLRMSGVPLMDMISGIPTPKDQAKIRQAVGSMYGGVNAPMGSNGWMEQYLTLRSIFGDSGAGLIMGVGGRTDQATGAETHQWNQRTAQAAAGTQTTSGIVLQRLRGQVEQGLYPAYSGARDALTGGGGGSMGALGWLTSSPLHLLEGYAAVRGVSWAAGKAIPAALRPLARALGIRVGAAGVVEAGAEAAGAGAAGGVWQTAPGGPLELAPASGGDAAGAAASTGGRSLAGMAGGLALGTAAAYGGLMLFPDSISQMKMSTEDIEKTAVSHLVTAAKKKFGDKWTSKEARNWMQEQLYHHGQGHYLGPNLPLWPIGAAAEGGREFDPSRYRGAAGQMLDKYLSTTTGDAAFLKQYGPELYGQVKFTQAVGDFTKAVDKFSSGGGGDHAKGTAGEPNATPRYVGYNPSGASGQAGAMFVGAPAAAALAGGAPGMMLAALTQAAGSGSVPVSGGGGGGGGAGQSVPVSSHGSYSIAQLVQLAQSVGFSGESAAIAAAVAMAESGGDPHSHATSGEDSRGLWQINVAPSANPQYANTNLWDPATNARIAYSMSGGGANWGPWTTYTSGRYRQFLDAARAALGGGSSSRGGGAAGSTVQALSRQGGAAAGHVMSAIASATGGGGSGGGGWAGGGGSGGDVHVHLHVDGRELTKHRVLTKGRA